MAAKSNSPTQLILGISFGVIAGLIIGSLWFANQLPRMSPTHDLSTQQADPIATSVVPNGTVIEQSCFTGGDNNECLFLMKGQSMPVGTGRVTGAYIGLQDVTNPWTEELVSCPVFVVKGGSEMVVEGLKSLSGGIVPVVNGETWWILGDSIDAAEGFNSSTVRVGVSIAPMPDGGVPACWSPMRVDYTTEML